MEKFNGGNCSEIEARRMIERGTGAAVQDALVGLDQMMDNLDRSAENEVLKAVLADAAGKVVADIKLQDVEKYRLTAAAGRVEAMIRACKDANVTNKMEAQEVVRSAVTKALGRNKNATDTLLMRFRYDAAAENVARLETACLKTNATVDDCRQQVERSAEDLAGKHINGTELEKIVRKGAGGDGL